MAWSADKCAFVVRDGTERVAVADRVSLIFGHLLASICHNVPLIIAISGNRKSGKEPFARLLAAKLGRRCIGAADLDAGKEANVAENAAIVIRAESVLGSVVRTTPRKVGSGTVDSMPFGVKYLVTAARMAAMVCVTGRSHNQVLQVSRALHAAISRTGRAANKARGADVRLASLQ